MAHMESSQRVLQSIPAVSFPSSLVQIIELTGKGCPGAKMPTVPSCLPSSTISETANGEPWLGCRLCSCLAVSLLAVSTALPPQSFGTQALGLTVTASLASDLCSVHSFGAPPASPASSPHPSSQDRRQSQCLTHLCLHTPTHARSHIGGLQRACGKSHYRLIPIFRELRSPEFHAPICVCISTSRLPTGC